jgi:hypothetical protein
MVEGCLIAWQRRHLGRSRFNDQSKNSRRDAAALMVSFVNFAYKWTFLTLLIACYVGCVPANRNIRFERNQAVRALQGLPRVRVGKAVESFVRAQQTHGVTVPDTVSLNQLVTSGFLGADEAAPFGDLRVTFPTAVDQTHPQEIIARVSLRSGGVILELVDGSIQEITK